MEPNVTLHWFVHPQWFEDLGGFTKEANIEIFVEWCRTAFSLFGSPGLSLLVCMQPRPSQMCWQFRLTGEQEYDRHCQAGDADVADSENEKYLGGSVEERG